MKYICDNCEKYPCSDDETKLMLRCPVFSPKPKPMTNADRIRAMSAEELATLLTDVAKMSAEKLCESLKTVDVDISNCDFDILYKSHLDWLKQEVSND